MLSAHEILSKLAQEKSFSEFLNQCLIGIQESYSQQIDERHPMEDNIKDKINDLYIGKMVDFLEQLDSPIVIGQIDAIKAHLGSKSMGWGPEFVNYIERLNQTISSAKELDTYHNDIRRLAKESSSESQSKIQALRRKIEDICQLYPALKREEQILALASGLHPRLGAGSPILTAYNNPGLGKKGLTDNLKTVLELAGLSDKDSSKPVSVLQQK